MEIRVKVIPWSLTKSKVPLYMLWTINPSPCAESLMTTRSTPHSAELGTCVGQILENWYILHMRHLHSQFRPARYTAISMMMYCSDFDYYKFYASDFGNIFKASTHVGHTRGSGNKSARPVLSWARWWESGLFERRIDPSFGWTGYCTSKSYGYVIAYCRWLPTT